MHAVHRENQLVLPLPVSSHSQLAGSLAAAATGSFAGNGASAQATTAASLHAAAAELRENSSLIELPSG